MIEPKRWDRKPQIKSTTQLKHLIKTKASNLAPIELEILLCPPRRTQKIGRDSGTGRLLKTKLLLLNINYIKFLNLILW
jgi:hypothetical protein